MDPIRISYSDSNWVVNPDDMKSTIGYVFNIDLGKISWSSKKQPIVSLSSMEAEYQALLIQTYTGMHHNTNTNINTEI